MTFIPGSLKICLILAFIGHIQGLQFSRDKIADSSYCGHLYCWAHKSFTDTNIQTVFSLTVYDVTNSTSSVQLVSLSVYDQVIKVDPMKINVINATGQVLRNSAHLTLALGDNSDCINGTFMCELDFVNLEGEPVLIRETTSESSGNCLAVNEIIQGMAQIDAQVDDLKKVNAELNKENVDLKNESNELRKTNNQLREELDKFQHQQVTCSRGSLQNNTREKFFLWETVPALCDTVTDGGGWIFIQRRTKGDVDFYRDWDDYKKGFGTPDTDFWIGNEVIHNLTLQGYTELRIDVEYQGRQYFAHYAHFTVDDETLNYRLNASGYNGTTGDSLTYHSGKGYTTYDKDNDGSSIGNCASIYHGAWWYHASCGTSNLNGRWGGGQDGLWWYGITSYNTSLTITEMKVRRV